MNVASIANNGQLKDIRVNDKFLDKDGVYELIFGEGRLIAHQRLENPTSGRGRTCTRKQAYLESLVENLARSRPGTMDLPRELKRLHDAGWEDDKLAMVACKSASTSGNTSACGKWRGTTRSRGRTGHFSDLLAILVAGHRRHGHSECPDGRLRQGIVNCSNFAKARALIGARMDKRKRRGANTQAGEYTVATLTMTLPMPRRPGIPTCGRPRPKKAGCSCSLTASPRSGKTGAAETADGRGLDKRPELSGTYNLAAA